jgi:hypothetical protein
LICRLCMKLKCVSLLCKKITKFGLVIRNLDGILEIVGSIFSYFVNLKKLINMTLVLFIYFQKISLIFKVLSFFREKILIIFHCLKIIFFPFRKYRVFLNIVWNKKFEKVFNLSPQKCTFKINCFRDHGLVSSFYVLLLGRTVWKNSSLIFW